MVPFFPLYFGTSLSKLKSRKRGTLIIKGLLWNLDGEWKRQMETRRSRV